MSQSFQHILVALTDTQWFALEALNDTWEMRDDPPALITYGPAQRRSHAPIRRAAAWARTGDPRAQALLHGGENEALCLLLGHEVGYWDADGTQLFVPGIPGAIDVLLDSGTSPVVRPGSEGRPYYAISGAVAFRPASQALSAGVATHEWGIDLVILACDPATLDGLDLH
ncbi:hypothetical protein [Deinococcus soli (ex Cha et al. 2016)]|uniref:Uncharacterized protein n=2 Tax=Deinococcus soli (ex Cha et al. 2016) TaxID=1309411 RepID=A0ACC6KMN5_9DEIO|nr:hypothetical protein [Deinococcus soli (ex Cha et al. 2016)]MDR6220979.1 hypothetical protein [Deinococcus soli (ex Cha et al. 2016)]MDR6330972.1 hypothetical protein [Deinococcus soli (ex Cha et al. 2016)]MDR6753701.1 hypothetical protein [Deinococcus soli (ex Cha et al. 2016)]